MKTVTYSVLLSMWIGYAAAAPVQKIDAISLLEDPGFKLGLALPRADHLSTDRIYPYGNQFSKLEPLWKLAEWGTTFYLTAADKKNQGKRVSYTNIGKRVTFGRRRNGMSFAMDVMAFREYKSARKAGESWPHLLIEQSFSKPTKIEDLEALRLHFTGRLTKSQFRMTKPEFDPVLHTAQFQLFLVVQDLNLASAGYSDYVWVGIPFYDYRKRKIPEYAAQDLGKDDATGKFVYCAATAEFMKGSFADGNWISISKDIYPIILRALELAKARGYLTKSAMSDFHLAGMNIGWEVPGTLDVGFECNYFDLLAYPKNNLSSKYHK